MLRLMLFRKMFVGDMRKSRETEAIITLQAEASHLGLLVMLKSENIWQQYLVQYRK